MNLRENLEKRENVKKIVRRMTRKIRKIIKKIIKVDRKIIKKIAKDRRKPCEFAKFTKRNFTNKKKLNFLNFSTKTMI